MATEHDTDAAYGQACHEDRARNRAARRIARLERGSLLIQGAVDAVLAIEDSPDTRHALHAFASSLGMTSADGEIASSPFKAF